MPFISTEHHKLYYTTAGNLQKPALLMLHGFLGSYQDFDVVLPELSQHFYCITPDLPGHGQTLTQSDGYTFSKTTQTLLSLLDSLGIAKSHILGYSMGGRLALYSIWCSPERFSRVVLESASPGLKTEQERKERKKRDWAIAQKIKTTPLSEFLTHWYKNPLFHSLKTHPELYQAMLIRRQNNNSIELANALRGFSTGNQPSLWKALAEIKTPLLLLVGEQDSKFVSLAQEMAALYQRNLVTVQVCSSCGHNVHLESPNRYVQTIVQFCLPQLKQ
ncbi:MAG: 2-succinyl-6-hydroxy-2,4-cyclohexadiene-1-carboxylate synthase [Leptolyngbya foveolarum]|uniref:Putative 2-succinyl-6-hydroxy-2,4-cyclohexadiene-1-carboxylate synthase n=1 Tax=Leptolyngbya foveolarum TaxID=47253 RepID=A0A2W4UJX6_9CYAN|nr:MAG: 2-succinyl-6-hydroxy-2,4-cyclohexadiene-1-carboxylate synthase [Leptolyngbya foveolarum]